MPTTEATMDTYSLRIDRDICIWKKEDISGNFPPRYQYTSTAIEDNKIVDFDGFIDSKFRYGTTHVLNYGKSGEKDKWNWQWFFHKEETLIGEN